MGLKGKTALVTGTGGYLGRALSKHLEEKGASIIPFDVAAGKDVTKWDHFKGLDKPDVVFHLQALDDPFKAWQNPRMVYRVNLGGTVNVLEFCRSGDVGRVIIVGTGSADFSDPFSRSMRLCEELALGYSSDYGLSSILVRPFDIYGKGQEATRLLPSLIAQSRKGKIQLGDPEAIGDFVHVKDVADAIAKAAEHRGNHPGPYEVGTGQAHTVKELVEMVRVRFGKPLMVTYTGHRTKGELSGRAADITRAKEELGWAPRINLDAGLRIMLGE